jgi:bile acid:Na+ symporter, BASS family
MLSIIVFILAIGMGVAVLGLDCLWKRPRLLWRSLFAMYVLVPMAALLLARFLPVGPAVKAALLVLAVSAGALLLAKMLATFGSSYAFSPVVTSLLLAIVLVPAWIARISRWNRY